MNGNLKTICDTVIKNIQTASAFYKIEYKSSFAVYGITNADLTVMSCQNQIKSEQDSSAATTVPVI